MTCTVCPNCGFDLERVQPIERGDIKLQSHEICWKGRRVPLRPSGRILVSAVVRADGYTVTCAALGEALGCEDTINPDNLVAVQLCHARRAFRQIDPTFSALQTVWGTGIRWAA